MGWVVNATPRPLFSRERPGICCIGGWVDPRAGLDGCGKSRLHRDSISGQYIYILSQVPYFFFGRVAELRETNISLIMRLSLTLSVRMSLLCLSPSACHYSVSLRPHVTTLLPLGGFSRSLVLENFSKN